MLEAFDSMRDTVEEFGGAKAEFATLAEGFEAIGSGLECTTNILEP